MRLRGEKEKVLRDVPAPASLGIDLQRARGQRAIGLGLTVDLEPCIGVAHEGDKPTQSGPKAQHICRGGKRTSNRAANPCAARHTHLVQSCV